MKTIEELDLGFSDAQNYSQRQNKLHFNDIFVRNQYLEDLIKPNTYFLIGEKGTGKTAYATYLCNNNYKGIKGIVKFINNTDYDKFYRLKQSKHLDVSDYVDVWRSILLLLLSKSIAENDRIVSLFNRTTIEELNAAIDEYYNKAFSPEIVNAMRIVDNSELMVNLLLKHLGGEGKTGKTVEINEQRIQMNLFYISKQFEDCLGKIKLNKNIVLLVDGIDVRPSSIPYEDYLECIRGLVNASWSLNTELFSNVRDTKGKMRIVLLLRPDIFNSLNLQNATNKLADNSVFLNWNTTYIEYENSYLYEMANKLLMFEQDIQNVRPIFESYFRWRKPSTNTNREFDTPFMEFLKISLSRPRDIQQILSIQKDIIVRKGKGKHTEFDQYVFESDEFQNAYSDYFLGSLKDQLSFYYTEDDYNYFAHFLTYFKKAEFTYDEFEKAYDQFCDYVLEYAKEIPKFIEDKREFLQMLYDSNVICTIEKENELSTFFHFSYREKGATNIAPKVLIGTNITYRFHYGLYKRASFGRIH